MKLIIFYLILPTLFFMSCSTSPWTADHQSVSNLNRQIAALRCEQLFENKKSNVLTDKENQSIDYTDFYRKHKVETGQANQLLMKSILERSAQLESQLQKNQVSEYDFILVGAGIHSGIVMSQIKEMLPNARILVLEKSADTLGVFGRTGETFFGNTLESDLPGTIHTSEQVSEKLKVESRNYIPNAPLQTYDLALGKVPQASDFAAPVIATFHKYKPDILFNVTVDQFVPNHKGGFSLKLPRGMGVVKGKLGGIGIGLGEANIPAVTSAGKELVRKGKDAGFIEEVLAEAQQAKKNPQVRKSFVGKFKDKDIVLLGGGHGSAIVIDLLLGYGPSDFYVGLPLENFKPKSITWVGLKDPKERVVTGAVFKEFIGGGTRYNHLGDRIDDGTIKVISQNCYIEPGQSKAVGLYFWNKAEKRFEVDLNGNKLGFETDFVAYAAGYNNSPITKMLTEYSQVDLGYQTMTVKGDIEPNDSRMTRKNVNIGKEVLNKKGIPSGVFLYGPSAGAIAEAADPGGATSPVINVMASRSKSLAQQLVKKFKDLPK